MLVLIINFSPHFLNTNQEFEEREATTKETIDALRNSLYNKFMVGFDVFPDAGETQEVNWDKAVEVIPSMLNLSREELSRLSMAQIMSHPKSDVVSATIAAISVLKSEDSLRRVAVPQGMDYQESYLERYKDIPPIFNVTHEIDSNLWECKTARGGRNSGNNMELTLKANPKVRVYVKEMLDEPLSENRWDLCDDVEVRKSIVGDLTSAQVEKTILSSGVPGVIHPLEIVGNKVALPFIDNEKMGTVGLSGGGMVIKRGESVVTVPLSAEQSLLTAKKYLDLLVNLNELGYAVPCQRAGDIEIRLNPNTGEVVCYDFGLCFPSKVVGEVSSEAERQNCQGFIDWFAYGKLSDTLANIFGLEENNFTFLENSPIKSLPSAAEISDVVRKIAPEVNFWRKPMSEKRALISEIAELADRGIAQVRAGGLGNTEVPKPVQMFLSELRNSASFSRMKREDLRKVFENAISGLAGMPTKAGVDENIVAAANSLSLLFQEALEQEK